MQTARAVHDPARSLSSGVRLGPDRGRRATGCRLRRRSNVGSANLKDRTEGLMQVGVLELEMGPPNERTRAMASNSDVAWTSGDVTVLGIGHRGEIAFGQRVLGSGSDETGPQRPLGEVPWRFRSGSGFSGGVPRWKFVPTGDGGKMPATLDQAGSSLWRLSAPELVRVEDRLDG